MKTALVLGGGGFIGGHLAKRLKSEGFWVRVVDIKEKHEFWDHDDICDEYISGDLRDPKIVSQVIFAPNQHSEDDKVNSFDEVYQLAADMGGAGYIFTGDNDANVMHNSALINLNVVYEAAKKSVKRVFYSSSACMYPEHNQLDPDNPNCEESSAYPANPDSEYGWEKLFSERLYLANKKNFGIDVKIARYHNIFGEFGTWRGGKEKAPAAVCRKVAELAGDQREIEIWGDGKQTRSFLYIEDCIDATLKLIDSKETGPINIGSEEQVSINQMLDKIEVIAEKKIKRKYLLDKPKGVRGRSSDNTMIKEKLDWEPKFSLSQGLEKTYFWIKNEMNKNS